ncbi:MAG: hypothetical protein SGI77_12125 [Pirellulaceae bacterium]|nr:hypothetical protein [Pirellulaceae bacterium]
MMFFCVNDSVFTQRYRLYAILLALSIALLSSAASVRGQGQFPNLSTNALANDQTMIEFTLPNQLTVNQLLKYVSERLQVRYHFKEDVGNTKISIQTPAKIPLGSLKFLVSSALKAEGLAIVDTDVSGTKQIIRSAEMNQFAPKGNAEEILRTEGAGAPVTQVFLLKKIQALPLSVQITQFSTTAKAIPITDSNTLIVTDYASNIKRIAELIEMLDSPAGESVFAFYEVKNRTPKALTDQASAIYGQKETQGDAPTPKSLRLFDDAKGNRILVAGRKPLVDDAMILLRQLDVELGLDTNVYRPKNLTAERLNKIIEGILPEQDLERAYHGTVDEDGNLLIVRATKSIHLQIENLLSQLDKTASVDDSPVRVHKLKNARAGDVLITLLALQQAYGIGVGGGFGGGNGQFFGGGFGGGIPGYPNSQQGGAGFGGQGFGQGFGGQGFGGQGFGGQGFGGQGFGGQGFGGLGGGIFGGLTGGGQFGNQGIATQTLPLQPGQPTTTGGTALGGQGGAAGGSSGRRTSQLNQSGANASGFGGGGSALLPGGARISADIGTNSLLIYAPSNIQPIYQKLIESLDTRRPQVMIEAKLVAIDTTDGFTLGIEASGGDRQGTRRAFKFTSFGLSEVDATTGALKIIPGRGFNGTIVDPEIADIVIRALATHTRSRVNSAPKLVVNNNATGTLESVVEIPFASVNASNTVSTTSVGGAKTAGTTISVTPQINEDDNLQLEFQIEFSSFTGTGTATLPPATNRQTIESVVTIPDGKTVIVGGLNREGKRIEYAGIPWIEQIPLIRDLLGRSDESKESTAFFVFIRPIILRDSRFQDLQYISDRQAGFMGIPSEYPQSQPVLMR